VNEEYGFTTEIIYRATGAGVAPFHLACTLDGVPLHDLPGYITVKLPVPAARLGDIDLMEVEHGGVVGVMAPMGAWPEGDYLVFTTNYI